MIKLNGSIVAMEKHLIEKVSGILVMIQNARNVVTCVVDSNSSSHTDNRKTDFLVLGKRDTTLCTNGSFGAPKNV